MDLDDKLTLAGAEGIDQHLVLAGIGSRGVALMLDLVVQALSFFVLGLVAGNFGDVGLAFFAVGLFLIVFGYPILLETFNGGQTVGKQAVGIAVTRPDGTPITFLAAVIRNLVRVVDAMPGVYTVGLIALFATKRCQRLGDLAAGTIVIRRNRQQVPAGGEALGYDAGWVELPAAPPEIATWDTSAITLDELAAIRTFLSRRHQLDAHHRHEIAKALADQCLPKVAGIPLDGNPELLLERIAYARQFR